MISYLNDGTIDNHFTSSSTSMSRIILRSFLSVEIPSRFHVTNSLAKWTVWSDIRRLRCQCREKETSSPWNFSGNLTRFHEWNGPLFFFFNYPRKDGSLYVRGEFFGRFVNAARLSCDFNFGETRHTRCGYCRRQDGRGEIKRWTFPFIKIRITILNESRGSHEISPDSSNDNRLENWANFRQSPSMKWFIHFTNLLKKKKVSKSCSLLCHRENVKRVTRIIDTIWQVDY